MALLNDLTIPQLLCRFAAFLLVTALHGFALAGIARLLGDQSPRYAGRFTLNPLPNLSLLALVMAILFRVGWVLPMKIAPEKLRFGRLGLVLCVVGSLLVVLAIVPVLWPLRPLVVIALPRTAALTVLTLMDNIQDIAIWFVAFNIIPVPPLTGMLLLIAVWPPIGATIWRRSKAFEVAMVVLAVIGTATWVAAPINQLLRQLIT